MSMSLMVKVMATKVGNPIRKLVLLKLADNANDSGECWPSYQHVADQCEIDRRTAMRHIEALEASGFLRKATRFGSHKGNSSNLFRITIDNGRPSVTESLGGVTESLGGSVTESPRTSHSLEPVKEPLSPAKQTTDPIPYEKIKDLYNAVCGEHFKKAAAVTQERKNNIKKCWTHKVDGNLHFQKSAFWEIYFKRCILNGHWRGENDRGWKASLEFVTSKKIMEKVVDEILIEMGAEV